MNLPRLLIAGSSGDSGKTLVTLGLIRTWRRKGIKIVPFKKGPDYIDPAWLTLASGIETHNLDTWMMERERVLRSFTKYSHLDAINLIEANRGLYDGEDAAGTHSSAVLAKLLYTPVVIVLPITKVTRTIAAFVLGLKLFDREVNIAGVILNRSGGTRHKTIVRRAIEEETGIPVLGAIPRIKNDPLPGRHLGLITPSEYSEAEESLDVAEKLISESVDTDKVLAITYNCEPLAIDIDNKPESVNIVGKRRIGYFSGSAFTFYYPENLEVLRSSNCSLIEINPLSDESLPEIDALYIGGGFPETHAALLSNNCAFMKSVAVAARQGLPIWAECGGLMFLAKQLIWQGNTYPMAGVIPADVAMHNRPQGHGYQEVEVDRDNPFLKVGTRIRGHEFHYSQIVSSDKLNTIFKVTRGTGIGEGRDGIIVSNVIASYLHIHSVATPEWGRGVLKALL
ncbi:MAG: cobyrinate a,c-diamide synthase [Candidatus Hatepunaea meridiana]|nr:cobyrinate a,c-diamide synthase [Candidatus Hatepunaea meridiana]